MRASRIALECMSRGLKLLSRRTTFEVERKFPGLAVAQLNWNAGSPCFRSLRYLGKQKFRDVYYDHRSKLSTGGIWIRQRRFENEDPYWEMKKRHGGTFNNSMFEELTDPKTIARYIQDIVGRSSVESNNFGLSVSADLVTTRRSWLADDEFKIVLDSMDFGHEVGEVELECIVAEPRVQVAAFDVDAWKRAVTQEMDNRIQAFMERYTWAFQKGEPCGKLTAYYERQRQIV